MLFKTCLEFFTTLSHPFEDQTAGRVDFPRAAQLLYLSEDINARMYPDAGRKFDVINRFSNFSLLFPVKRYCHQQAQRIYILRACTYLNKIAIEPSATALRNL